MRFILPMVMECARSPFSFLDCLRNTINEGGGPSSLDFTEFNSRTASSKLSAGVYFH
jgi:hypothetical protein